MGIVVSFFLILVDYEVANRGVADYEVTDYTDYEVTGVVFCFSSIVFFPFCTRVKWLICRVSGSVTSPSTRV